MERVALQLLLASPHDACATLASILGDFTLKRDPSSSVLLVARFALLRSPGGLPPDVLDEAVRTCVPLMLGWATSNFHTVRSPIGNSS